MTYLCSRNLRSRLTNESTQTRHISTWILSAPSEDCRDTVPKAKLIQLSVRITGFMDFVHRPDF
jgi:hypothetical protein